MRHLYSSGILGLEAAPGLGVGDRLRGAELRP